jgi:hypothetical protein
MNTETMRLLVSKGLSAADILEISETLDAPTERSKAAERQARYRARMKGGDVTCDVTRDGNSDVTSPPLSRPPNENISNPPTHTPPDITTRAREADPFPKPDWADLQVWRDLKANRKAKRLPCTPTAHAKLLRDIGKMASDEWPPGRLLEAIVARGWAAAYDPREGPEHAKSRQSPANDEPINPYVRAVVARQADRAAGIGGESGSWP